MAKSETHIATIESDQYLNEIMMATARLVFPHFGLRGWVEHYIGCTESACPVATHEKSYMIHT